MQKEKSIYFANFSIGDKWSSLRKGQPVGWSATYHVTQNRLFKLVTPRDRAPCLGWFVRLGRSFNASVGSIVQMPSLVMTVMASKNYDCNGRHAPSFVRDLIWRLWTNQVTVPMVRNLAMTKFTGMLEYRSCDTNVD